ERSEITFYRSKTSHHRSEVVHNRSKSNPTDPDSFGAISTGYDRSKLCYIDRPWYITDQEYCLTDQQALIISSNTCVIYRKTSRSIENHLIRSGIFKMFSRHFISKICYTFILREIN